MKSHDTKQCNSSLANEGFREAFMVSCCFFSCRRYYWSFSVVETFFFLLVKWSSHRLKCCYQKHCLRGWLPTKNAKNDTTVFTNLKGRYLRSTGRAALFMSWWRRHIQLRAVSLMTTTEVTQGWEFDGKDLLFIPADNWKVCCWADSPANFSLLKQSPINSWKFAYYFLLNNFH